MFASKSIVEHLARGAAGLGALAAFVVLAAAHPWLSLPLIPLALVALRGCPMCWTVGLVQTVLARLQGKASSGPCIDGSCAVRAQRRTLDETSRPPR